MTEGRTVKVRLEKGGCVPERKTPGASGYDLFCAEDVFIKPGHTVTVPTGVCLEIPTGLEGQVRSRSGLASTFGVFVLNSPGTVDSDYRGEVRVIMHNLSDKAFFCRAGTRIAQLVFCPVEQPCLVTVDVLSDTQRGSGGLGSTGT